MTQQTQNESNVNPRFYKSGFTGLINIRLTEEEARDVLKHISDCDFARKLRHSVENE